VLVGQPAKNLLYSRNARSVVGHELLLGMQYDSPEATALRTPDTALRTPGTQSVRLPCPVRDLWVRETARFQTWQNSAAARSLGNIVNCQSTKTNNRSATVCSSCVVRTRDEAR